jgi:hypothetical protein
MMLEPLEPPDPGPRARLQGAKEGVGDVPIDLATVEDVEKRLRTALNRNRKQEWLIIGLLLTLFLLGLVLIGYGVLATHWAAIPGTFLEGAIYFPIRELTKLRAGNIRLLSIPPLLRLANEKEAQKVVIEFVQRLISQVEP